MSDVKLRDCPFCGSMMSTYSFDDVGTASDGGRQVRIECSEGEECQGNTGWCDSMEEAAAAWNTRAESPVEKAAGEMYKALEARQEADAAWKNDKTAHNVCHEMTKKAEEFARTALAAFDKAKEGK